MIVWFKRHFGQESYTATFDLFGKMFIQAGAPTSMLLVCDRETATTLYMRLPDEGLARLFAGFGEMLTPPAGHVSLLVGQTKEFKALFD
jgi:hypothetical protein